MESKEHRISRGKGYGYIRGDGLICMEICFYCGRHNYQPAVSSGACWTCGFKAGQHDPKHEKRVVISDKRRECMDCAGYGRDGKPCNICKSINPSYVGLSFPSTPYGLTLSCFVYLESEETK
jgi:hypothetical protein